MSFRKPLKVVSISLLSIILLVIIVSVVFTTIYEKTLIRYMKDYLDKHLLTELSMGDINFHLLKGFPNATIEITDAVVLSGKDFSKKDFHTSFSDTLLKAETISLKFDILKIIRKEYELKNIEISNGQINILFDNSKHHNLKIWKSTEGNGNYLIKLKNIVAVDSRIRIVSLPQDFSFYTISDKIHFKGTLNNNTLSGNLKGTVGINDFTYKEKKMIKDGLMRCDINLLYSGDYIKVNQGTVQLNKALASVEGEIKGGKETIADLTIKMSKFGLEELMSILPSGKKIPSGDFEFKGNGNLYLIIKGSLTNINHLLIKSGFELNNCSAKNTKTRGTINKLNLIGSITGTNSANFTLKIDSFSAMMGKGTLNGQLTLKNLKDLQIKSDLRAKLDLEALHKFINLDTLEKMDGFVNCNVSASGTIKTLIDSVSNSTDLLIKNSVFEFEEASFKIREMPMALSNISGRAIWDEHVKLDNLNLKINETNLLLDGSIYNLLNYLFKNGLIKSDINIIAEEVDITKYINKPANNKSSTGYKSLSVFPSDINLNVNLKANSFIAGRFKATKLNLSMTAFSDSVYIKTFSLHFPDGSIAGNAGINLDDEHTFAFTCKAHPQDINIQQLFYSFNNFSQHFIIDKNMKGYLSGNIVFYAEWDSTLKLIQKSMKADGDFQIKNGELLEFEPMMKLSKYINIDELKHIRFRTLENTISINNRLINIPEMAINSSAFNISLSGNHSFDNNFDYRLRVLLSEILFNKARKKKKEINEFLVEENTEDQTTIPFIIAGSPELFDVKLDRKKAFSLTKNKFINKNNEVPLKSNSNNVKVEWEDEPSKKEDTKSSGIKTNNSDIIVEWEE